MIKFLVLFIPWRHACMEAIQAYIPRKAYILTLQLFPGGRSVYLNRKRDHMAYVPCDVHTLIVPRLDPRKRHHALVTNRRYTRCFHNFPWNIRDTSHILSYISGKEERRYHVCPGSFLVSHRQAYLIFVYLFQLFFFCVFPASASAISTVHSVIIDDVK